MIAFAVDWDGGEVARDGGGRLLNESGASVVIAAGGALSRAAASVSRDSEVASLPAANLLACLDGRLDELGELRHVLECDSSVPAALVLLHGYVRFGTALLDRLRGDFAFVVWNGLEGSIFAARDPFGVRPMHYAIRKRQLFFASDSDQLVRAGVVDPVPDDRMVIEFLTRKFVSHERSFFRDVKRIPAGHSLFADTHGVRIAGYRRPPTSELSFSSTRECMEAVRERLQIAVRRRLSTDSLALIELSGGVDSSSIACLSDHLIAADGRLSGRVMAAAGVHSGLPCDEWSYIQAVERAVRFPVISWDATRVDARDLLEPVLAAPGSAVAMAGGGTGVIAIARENGIRVLMNGTGGDQVGEPLGIPLDQIRSGHWRDAVRAFAARGVSMQKRARFLRWAMSYLSPGWVRELRRMLRPASEAPAWLVPEALDPFRSSEAQALAELDASNRAEFLSVGQHLRWRSITRATLSASVDLMQRNARNHGLGTALPFLDWDLVSFLLSVPYHQWPSSGPNPRIHREALKGVLPAAIYGRRSKAEFTPAMANRVMAQLGVITELFEGPIWESAPYVSQIAARRLLSSFRTALVPDLRVARGVWAIAAVETWLRRVLSYSPVKVVLDQGNQPYVYR